MRDGLRDLGDSRGRDDEHDDRKETIEHWSF
jgi:hypothetical protein